MMVDLEDRLRQSFATVAAATTIPEVPTVQVGDASPLRPRRRRGRFGIGALAIAGLSIAGIGGATAAGVFSHDAQIALEDQPVDQSHVVQLGNMAGPVGTRIKVYTAPAADHGRCLGFLLIGDPAWAGHSMGGECAGDHSVGGSVGNIKMSIGHRPTIAIFAYLVPDAASAVISAPNGASRSAIVSDGYVIGWVPQSTYVGGHLIVRGSDGRPIEDQPLFPAN